MPPIKVGRAATRIKTTYKLINHAQRGALRHALVERTRVGQLTDTCLIIVVSYEPILLNGSLRQLAAWSQSRGSFRVKASDPEAWFGSTRLDEAQRVFSAVVRRGLGPRIKRRAPRRPAR